MKCNVGQTDKVIRIILGVLIAVVGLYFKTWWGLVAIIPLGTALVNFCPLYAALGLTTCEKK